MSRKRTFGPNRNKFINITGIIYNNIKECALILSDSTSRKLRIESQQQQTFV